MTETRPAPQAVPALLHRLMAEATGTFALVLVGTGAIACSEELGHFGHMGICLAFGAVVTAMVLAFGTVSGAHINPAVTIGFAAAHRLRRQLVAPYITAQLLGALLASLVVHGVFPANASLGATLPAIGWWPSFAVEVGLTFVLMFVILWVSSHPRARLPAVALTVGATVMLAAYFMGPHTGASMNPARSFGPALVTGGLTPLPLYFAAPVLGALLAVPICRLRGRAACCPQGVCP